LATGVAVSLSVLGSTAVSSASTHAAGTTQPLVVWVDSTRVPFVKAYEKAFPNVKIDLVTYDGDANGDGTMQTKTALFNRVGHGWPDVIFSEQNIDIAFRVADRAYVMANGRISDSGLPAELREAGRLHRSFFGDGTAVT